MTHASADDNDNDNDNDEDNERPEAAVAAAGADRAVRRSSRDHRPSKRLQQYLLYDDIEDDKKDATSSKTVVKKARVEATSSLDMLATQALAQEDASVRKTSVNDAAVTVASANEPTATVAASSTTVSTSSAQTSKRRASSASQAHVKRAKGDDDNDDADDDDDAEDDDVADDSDDEMALMSKNPLLDTPIIELNNGSVRFVGLMYFFLSLHRALTNDYARCCFPCCAQREDVRVSCVQQAAQIAAGLLRALVVSIDENLVSSSTFVLALVVIYY